MKSSKIMRQTAAAVAADSRNWKASAQGIQQSNRSKNDDQVRKILKARLRKRRRDQQLQLGREVALIRDGQDHFFPLPSPGLEGWPRLRRMIWDVFEPDELLVKSTLANIVTMWIVLLVVVSSCTAVIETLPSLRQETTIWEGLEWFFQINFTVELVAKLISCPALDEFFLTGRNWIDIVVVLPFWFEQLYNLFSDASMPNLTFVRLLRLGKGMRLVKLGRFSSGVELLTNAIANSVDALQLFVIILLISVVACASMMFYLEKSTYHDGVYHRAYDRGFEEDGMLELVTPSCWYANYTGLNTTRWDCIRAKSPLQSIPHSAWFCMVSLMTVGFGDVIPITYMGQVAASITVLVGIITLVLPLSIIQSSFVDERRKHKVEMDEEKNLSQVRKMIEAAHDPDPEEVKALQKLEEETEVKGEDWMLLPALKSLVGELNYTREQMPLIGEKARECVELIQGLKQHSKVDYDTSWQADLPGHSGTTAPPSKVHPAEALGDESLPCIPGTTLTGKMYFVPIKDLQRIYSHSRGIFLTSSAVQAHWTAAVVESSTDMWQEIPTPKSPASPTSSRNDVGLPPVFANSPPEGSGGEGGSGPVS